MSHSISIFFFFLLICLEIVFFNYDIKYIYYDAIGPVIAANGGYSNGSNIYFDWANGAAIDFDDDGLSSVISDENVESDAASNAVSSCPTDAISYIEED